MACPYGSALIGRRYGNLHHCRALTPLDPALL